MKMPAIPLDHAKQQVRRLRDWLASRAAPTVIEIPSRIERIGYSLGRKTRNVLHAIQN